jgi:hypothetical protein
MVRREPCRTESVGRRTNGHRSLSLRGVVFPVDGFTNAIPITLSGSGFRRRSEILGVGPLSNFPIPGLGRRRVAHHATTQQ